MGTDVVLDGLAMNGHLCLQIGKVRFLAQEGDFGHGGIVLIFGEKLKAVLAASG